MAKAKAKPPLPFIGGCAGWLLLLAGTLSILLHAFWLAILSGIDFGSSFKPSDFYISPLYLIGWAALGVTCLAVSISFLRRQKWAWLGYLALIVGSIGYECFLVGTRQSPSNGWTFVPDIVILVVLILPSVRQAFFGKARKIKNDR